MTGEAFTFVSPQEEAELRAIERAVGRALPRVTLPDFDYAAKPEGRLERPLAERLAEHSARRRNERQRANAKKTAAPAAPSGAPSEKIERASRGRRRRFGRRKP
jgi:ATP-dependent RNA helicase RhlE